MNRFISLFCCFLFVIGSTSAQNTLPSVKIGDIVAELQKQDDTTRVVNLWATWCAPCVKELPHFIAEQQASKDKKLKIILLAVEDKKATVEAFIKRKNYTANFAFLDETDANKWIPQINPDWEGEIPVTLVVNNAKKIKHFHSGDLTAEALKELITQ
jgi:thiol-disulfide isomerase/thioredoxin